MKLIVLGSGAGLPSKDRNTQSIILDCVDEYNEYILFDVGEATQHRILNTHIKPSKIKNIFITHLHGDHIFGLPGFLSSRAFQGGQNIPLTIYGPKGIEEWLESTFSVSKSTLNYDLNIVEVEADMKIALNNFDVSVHELEHGIESFVYILKEKDKIGELNSAALKDLGIPPGPIYSDIKRGENFEFEGQIYESKDFIGDKIKGRKIAIHGDTRVVSRQAYLDDLKGADLIVHEATFFQDESQKAHDYFHSEINHVLDNFKDLSYKILVFVHISNRYDDADIDLVKTNLKDNVFIAHDYFELPIPRNVQ